MLLFAYLIAKQKESKEKTVEVGCQDAQVHRGGTSDLNHQRHKAVQAKHTEGKRHKQQGCGGDTKVEYRISQEEIRRQRHFEGLAAI